VTISDNPTALTTLADHSGTYHLDPAHTRIGFVARHAMVTKVRGGFNDFEGTLTVVGDDLTRSSAEVTIQAHSIDTRNTMRDDHLRSNDFLSMDEHPVIRFRSTSVRQTGEMSLELTGDLTIKDVTRAITVPFEFEGAATDPSGYRRLGFEGAVDISRKDYGITWNATLDTGGVLVSDKITLEFEVSAVRA